MLDGKIDTLHFDEAWLPHAAFHDFYGDYHAIGADRPRCKGSRWCSRRSRPTTAGRPRRRRRYWCRMRKTGSLTATCSTGGLPDAPSTSPQYSIIASCDVAAAMMEQPAAPALVEESIAEALDFRRAMHKGGRSSGAPTGGSRSGAGRPVGGHRGARRVDAQARPALARLRQAGRRLQHARPIKATIITRASMSMATSPTRHSGGDRHQIPPSTASSSRNAASTLHHVLHRHHRGRSRWSPSCSSSRTTMTRTSPCGRCCRSSARSTALRAVGLRDLCQQIHDVPKQPTTSRPDHRNVSLRHGPRHAPGRRLCAHGAPRDRAAPIDGL